MDEEDNNTNLTIDTSSITIPIIEENDKLFSSMSTNSTRDVDGKVVKDHRFIDENTSHLFNLDSESNPSVSYQSDSPDTIILNLLHSLINEIETNENQTDINIQLTSLPIIEDDQLEIEEDNDDDEENEDEDDEDEGHDHSDKSTTNKIEKEQTINKSLKNDLKPTTRTLRSHARKKSNLSNLNTNSSSLNSNHHNTRRMSNRRRALGNRILLNTNERERRRKTSERLRKEKEYPDDHHASSNSDDQTMESNNEKVSNPNDDASSCSSTGAGDGGSSTSSSTHNPKQSNDMEFLPPNKRRLRERNTYVSTNPTEPSENSPQEPVPPTVTREIPVNGIRQFLEIRQQIDKRHETMLNEFVLPKIPKDFSETTMAKKSYLIAPGFSSYMSTTPASIGIKRYVPPHDLDPHLIEVFSKQEEERYRMKLRHQVERDKLILSHEQEVLRLCGNATRSSINQDIPFSYCSLLKDNEVYNNPSMQSSEKILNNEYSTTELGKRGKHRWNGRSFIKWLEDSNLKYKRLSCELNERQRLECDTLYSMQRMVWLKHLPKEASNLNALGRSSYLLSERYLPKVEINPNFWSHWETNPF